MKTPTMSSLQAGQAVVRRRTVGAALGRATLPLALILLLAFGSLTSDSFLTVSNLLNVLNSNAAVGLVALGMTFVAVSGGLADLSVPATIAMGALVTLGAQSSLGPAGAAFLGILVATAGGVANGFLIGYLRINPIVVTLGTGSLLLGLSQLLVGGGIVYGEPSALADAVGGELLGIPVFVWIFAFAAVILHPLLSRTAWGRWNYAVGDNYVASEASAVPVRLTKGGAFVLTGLLAGMCGAMIALSNGQARPIIGTGYEFTAITAVVLGGTSLFGGTGSVLRTVGGVLITGLIGNLVIQIGLSTQTTGLISGTLLLLAVAVDAYFRRRAGRE